MMRFFHRNKIHQSIDVLKESQSFSEKTRNLFQKLSWCYEEESADFPQPTYSSSSSSSSFSSVKQFFRRISQQSKTQIGQHQYPEETPGPSYAGDDEYALRAQERRRLMFLKEVEENAAAQKKTDCYYDNESEKDIIVTYKDSRCYHADDETDHSTEYEIVYETEEARYQREYKEAIRRSLEDQERAMRTARRHFAGSGKQRARQQC